MLERVAGCTRRSVATTATTATTEEPSRAGGGSGTAGAGTAFVMMNMGGPATQPDVGPFLHKYVANSR